MQIFAVQPGPRQPTSKGGIDMSGEANQHGDIHSLGEQPQAHLDPVGVGFQVIEGRVASRTETDLAALTFEGLDIFPFASFTVPNQRMNSFIGVHRSLLQSRQAKARGHNCGRDDEKPSFPMQAQFTDLP